MADPSFGSDRLWYIRLGPDSKLPRDEWGGYSQAYADAPHVYSHADLQEASWHRWGIVGVQDTHRELSLLVFDLDIHKASGEFNPDDVTVPEDAPLVKTKNGGFHVYFIVPRARGSASESDFTVIQDIDWEIDIRGSLVSHHVVAPAAIPGVESEYELVNDASIPVVADPAGAAERIRYRGEPLLAYDAGAQAPDFEIDPPEDPPENLPRCYRKGLELRHTAPADANYNPHQVNVLAALCGLGAGYDVETIAHHFVEAYPPAGNPRAADRAETVYQLRHLETGGYSPPALSTLRAAGILNETGDCDCPIPYHGGESGTGLDGEQLWEWWSGKRLAGDLGEESLIFEPALRYIAEREDLYDFDALPDDVDELPIKAHNRALRWLESVWADEHDLHDDEDATALGYRARDPDRAWTWEDVRYIYEESKEDGRYAAVKLLRDEFWFLTPEDTEELHVYNDETGIFEPGGRYDIGRLLDRNLETYYSQTEKSEILGRLKEIVVERTALQAGAFDAPLVCVDNGVLDISEPSASELRSHDPEYLFTKRLPVAYDPEASCPRIEGFLENITRREADALTLLELLGNCLLPDYRYHKVLILFGEGANGKSTWLNVVREFLGSENTTSLPLQKLADNTFATARLLGKWANIAEDLPAKKLTDTGILKDLSGGGEIAAEKKGKDGFDFENSAKLLFAANRPPVLGERSYAIQRRLVPVYLPNRYTDDPDDEYEDRVPGLIDELTTPAELRGLLNAALAGLERLQSQGDVSLPESFEERLELYERHSDHIKAFRIDALTNERGARVQKADVYAGYTNYCNEHGHDPVGARTFWRNIRKTTLDVSVVRPSANDRGERPRMLDNATFTEVGSQYAPDYAAEEGDESESPTVEPQSPDPTPIVDLNGQGNPFVTLTVEVTHIHENVEKGPVYEATLQDTSGTIELIDWFGCQCLDEIEAGTCYRLVDVKVGFDTHGTLRVEPIHNTTRVVEIQHGVGYTMPAADDVNESLSGSTTANGGSFAQLEAQIMQWFRSQNNASATAPAIAGTFNADAEQVAAALDTLCGKGRLQYLDGEYEPT